MKTNYKILLAIAVVGIGLTSCYKHNWETLHPGGNTSTTPCVIPDTVSYNRDVVPIINANCGVSGTQGPSCHDATTANDLTNYAGVSSWASADSTNRIYLDITWNSNGNQMPKGEAKLTQCDINKIIRWMDQGSLNN